MTRSRSFSHLKYLASLITAALVLQSTSFGANNLHSRRTPDLAGGTASEPEKLSGLVTSRLRPLYGDFARAYRARFRHLDPEELTIRRSCQPAVPEPLWALPNAERLRTFPATTCLLEHRGTPIAEFHHNGRDSTLRFDVAIARPFRRLGLYRLLFGLALSDHPQATEAPYYAPFFGSGSTRAFATSLGHDPLQSPRNDPYFSSLVESSLRSLDSTGVRALRQRVLRAAEEMPVSDVRAVMGFNRVTRLIIDPHPDAHAVGLMLRKGPAVPEPQIEVLVAKVPLGVLPKLLRVPPPGDVHLDVGRSNAEFLRLSARGELADVGKIAPLLGAYDGLPAPLAASQLDTAWMLTQRWPARAWREFRAKLAGWVGKGEVGATLP